MAGFTFTENNGSGRFKMSGRPSIFTDGVEFTLTEVVTGTWTNEKGELVNKDDSNSIRFKTSLSDKLDDAININKLITKRKIVWDEKGHAKILYDFEQHEELSNFLEKFGRDPKDSRMLIGSAKEIGEKVLNEFFGGKTLIAKQVNDVFFKTIVDKKEKFEIPYDPIIILAIKQ